MQEHASDRSAESVDQPDDHAATTAGLHQRSRLHALARILELSGPDVLRRARHFDPAARRRRQLNAVHAGSAHLPAADSCRPSVQRVRRMTHIRVLAVGGLVLLLAACSSGSSSPARSGRRSEAGAVSFAQCMRAHSVPNWPDPNSSGVFDKTKITTQQLKVSSTALQAAQNACQALLPAESVTQQRLNAAQALQFSQCVRNHGVPNFPDPDGSGRIPDPPPLESIRVRRSSRPRTIACAQYRPPVHSVEPGVRRLRRHCECIMRRTTGDVLAVGGLRVVGALLTACSSGKAAPPVAHLAGSSGATASPNNALHLAGECMREHGLPDFPDPAVATDGPAAGQAILDKSALKSYSDGVVNQAITACRSALDKAGHRQRPGFLDHQPARAASTSRVGPLYPRPRGAELPRPESHDGRRHAAARPEQELPEHPRGDPGVPVASSSRRSQPGRIVGAGNEARRDSIR